MLLKTFFLFSLFFIAYSYELPKVKVSKEQSPIITLFKADSIVIDNVKKYKLTWKTENATHVQITFLGNVKPSDSVIITEQEYQRGPITLTATTTKNSLSDSKTINKFIKADKEAPLIIRKESNDSYNYNTPIPARHFPYTPRRIPPRRVRPY